MTEYQSEGKRITLKRARPNPLFQEWLEKLLEEAKAKQSKLEPMLHEAMTSLSKYPLPLESGAECAILKGFDRRLCKFLDNRLTVYNSWNCEPQDTEEQSPSEEQPSVSDPTVPKKRARKTRNKNIISNVVASENSNSESIAISDANNVIVIGDHDTPEPCASGRNAKKAPPCQNSSEPSILSSKNENIIPIFQDSSELNSQNACIPSTNEDSPQSSAKSSKKPCKGRNEYKPSFRSGGYAILMALFEHQRKNPSDSALNKEELINIAQKYSEESFLRPKPESFYTAWSTMSSLVTKGLVNHIRKKKTEYSLTDQGIVLAAKLWEDTKNTPTINDIIFNKASRPVGTTNGVSENGAVEISPSVTSENTTESQSNILEEITTIQFAKGSFEVILLIDKNETGGVSNKNDPTVAQFNKFPNLKHEYRSLKVGDFTWVIRHKVHKDQELVLPYIVERKRMDDLGASVKDGRFHEQKFRLRKCGLKNVIYLVESYGSNKHVGLPLQSLMQAMANTRIQDGFKVQGTESLTHTARFLAMMTKRLTIEYEAKPLITGIEGSPPDSEILMTFNYFNKSSVKNKPLTVKEAFIKLLLQLKGVSVEKALAITNVYNTPKLLIKEYEKHNQKEGEKLLANLKYGDSNRNVGPSVSKAIHSFFTWNE